MALCGGDVVVALDPPEVVRADLLIGDGRILGTGRAPGNALRRDCAGTLVMPGNVCAHHHLYSSLSRGMPYTLEPPSDFTEILQRVWWRLDRALDPESVRSSALRGGLDALLAGTTSIADHHASPEFVDGSLDVIADALAELGIRSVLCYEVTERDGPERALAGIAENRRFLAGRRPLARGMVGAHAGFTVSDETLAGCVDVAEGAGSGVHIHVAEDSADEEDSLERFGERVVDRLARVGILTGRALLGHCVHVNDSEVALIEQSGATVVCNPRSNMHNGVGLSPFNRRAGRIALGTDGIGGDMLSEAQAGFFRTREAGLDVPPDWPLVRLAEGARFVGARFEEPLLGTLRPGAPADVCVWSYDAPAPLDGSNLAGHLVFGLAAGSVRDVYVAGELVVADGRSTRVDGAELAADASAAAGRLWRRLDTLPAHPYEPQGRRKR